MALTPLHPKNYVISARHLAVSDLDLPSKSTVPQKPEPFSVVGYPTTLLSKQTLNTLRTGIGVEALLVLVRNS